MQLNSILILVALAILSVVSAAPVNLEKRYTVFKGKASWFSPESEGGVYGACGPKETSSSPIVALNRAQYGNMNRKSKLCGKKILIKGPRGSTYARINDACPGCAKGSLDLTPAVFKKVVGKLDIGVAKITWHLV